MIGISDRIEDDSASAIERLREMGVETMMMTGDNQRTALAVAREVGIERVIAEVLPDEKADEVGALQEEGRRPHPTAATPVAREGTLRVVRG